MSEENQEPRGKLSPGEFSFAGRIFNIDSKADCDLLLELIPDIRDAERGELARKIIKAHGEVTKW